MSDWTLFKPRTSGTALKGMVSVSKGGLTVAQDLTNRLTRSRNIDKKAIEIYHDGEGRIGLKLGAHGYKLRKTDSGSISISCKAVITDLKLIKGAYPATWNEAEEMLVFEPRREG